jgi:DNA polymerase-3 subunit epsilon
VEEHNARVRAALENMRLQAWPYEGAIGIREGESLHVIDGWAYLGTIAARDDASLLTARGRRRFDRDVYQILRKWLPRMGGSIVALPG